MPSTKIRPQRTCPARLRPNSARTILDDVDSLTGRVLLLAAVHRVQRRPIGIDTLALVRTPIGNPRMVTACTSPRTPMDRVGWYRSPPPTDKNGPSCSCVVKAPYEHG